MSTQNRLVEEFLSQKRIAVTGVSREKIAVGNTILQKLKNAGYQVYAVNPHADKIADVRCYHRIQDISDEIDGVVITNHPKITEQIVQDCAEKGVPRVWMHRSFGRGSYSASAEAFCKKHNIRVIPAGCPMMSCEPVDPAHRCMHWILRLAGRFKQPEDRRRNEQVEQ